MNDTLAEITTDPNSHQVAKVRLRIRQLTFNCRRCAVFCCKLGAPKLTQSDIQRLEKTGFRSTDTLCRDQSTLKKGQDGSCILLSRDQRHGLYKCTCYSVRPTLCRLYPFRFEKLGHNLFALKLIPCCNGINSKKGEKVDTKFVDDIANSVLIELIHAGWL